MITEKVIDTPQNNPVDFKELFSQAKKKWYWYVVSLLVFVGIAAFYNKIAIPTYNVSTTILINEDENSSHLQPGNLMTDFSLFSINRSFENEIYIFKSKPIIEAALKKLSFQISYFHKSSFKYREVYNYSPFIVVFDQDHPQPVNLMFEIEVLENFMYRIKAKGKEVQVYSFASDKIINRIPFVKINEEHSFGDSLNNENYSFKIVLNKNYNFNTGSSHKYSFVFNNVKKLVNYYANAIIIEPIKEDVNLARITLETPAVNKSIDFFNSLTNEYINRSLDKRNFIAINTINYIDNQLSNINDSLQRTEMKLQNFQSNNEVMDIGFKSSRLYEQMRDLQTQNEQLDLKIKYYNVIRENFESNQNIAEMMAPSSMGIEDPVFNSMIQQLIIYDNEKKTLIDNKQEKSPYLKQLDIKIENLKNTILENTRSFLDASSKAQADINRRISQLTYEINKLPRTSRELTGIERKFNVNDEIYTYLLQRKAESEISRASSMPNLEIIEPPDQEGSQPVSPMKKLNYLIALFLALVVPTGVIVVMDYFNDHIKDEKSFERHLRYPLIGKVVHNYHKVDDVMVKHPSSSTSESFRHIRTNLPFFLKGKTNQVILITSSFGGEGKTFIALNLATSLALYNRKTIILDFDLRKPRLTEVVKPNTDKGIVSFLLGDAPLESIIIKQVANNLDFIPAGIVPPNPVELIATERTKLLFSDLRAQYDYVIVDSPPIGIVSDSYVLMEHSGFNLLVARQDYTSIREFDSIQKELTIKGIKNLCVILNDIQGKHGRYGYGYYVKEPGKSDKRAV